MDDMFNETHVSAFYYGNSLPSIISAAKLLRLKTAESSEESRIRHLSPFAIEARIPLQSEMEELYGFHNFPIFEVNYGGGGTTIMKRNERERFRVRCVNDGYERLRECLPINEGTRRISKVDILRLAIQYIKHLEAILACNSHWHDCDCFYSFQTEAK